MRYVIVGAGAVGGTIGGRLHQSGRDVVLLARGAHLDALRAGGMTLRTPDAAYRLDVPAVGAPSDIEWAGDEIVVLATKTQDTPDALAAVAAAAPPTVTLVCAQNGVENERLALRRFERVQAICVMLPATHLEPGVVEANGTPLSGILDVGRYPAGADDVSERIADDLSESAFSSRADPRVMRQKYGKLLMNLGNALEAACGGGADVADLHAAARAEGVACFTAAGIDFTSSDEDAARRGDLLRMKPIDGKRRGGGSSWQSLARGTGSIESDHLNGEIVLLGRLHGVPTPVNALLQETANRMARERRPPGSVAAEELRARLAGTATVDG